MFTNPVHLTPKPVVTGCADNPEASATDFDLLQFASSVSSNTSFVRARVSAESSTTWTPRNLNAGASSFWIDYISTPPTVTPVELNRAFCAAQRRCEAASAALVAPIARLRDEALAVFQDDSGLKRFPPITLAVPSFAPGSRVPDTERATYYHSALRPRAPLSVMAATRGAPVDVHVAAAALVLFERVEQHLETQHRRVTAHMMHRLLVGCLSLAIKMHGDDNDAASKALPTAVGLERGEVGRLELQVLQDLDWNCFVSLQDIQRCMALPSRAGSS